MPCTDTTPHPHPIKRLCLPIVKRVKGYNMSTMMHKRVICGSTQALKFASRNMSTKPSSAIPSTQSSNQPPRPTPTSSTTDFDGDTYGEVPRGREGQSRTPEGDEFAPKTTDKFADKVEREVGDDHTAK